MRKLNRITAKALPNKKSDPTACPMFFLTGPRQVGKTFLTKTTEYPYFNWDTIETKKAFLKDPYFFRSEQPWVIFDEIHKRRDWKKLMKGYFDSPERKENFIITGSGRFNLSQKGGDSLQGRYDLYHLMPICYREFIGISDSYSPQAPNFNSFLPHSPNTPSDKLLLELGGFPEPLLRGQEAFLNKWMDMYIQRLVQEDIRDFSRVQEIDKIEMLARILPNRVCSPLSLKALSEDIEVSRDSIKTWMRLFEILYLGFTVPPFSRKIHRAIKKEQKWYFYQWTFCENPAARFENYIATQLYTLCTMWRDLGLGVFELQYLRDQDRREVDFVITKNKTPIALIEAKLTEKNWLSSLDFYAQKLAIPSFIVTENSPTRRIADNKWIVSSKVFFDTISRANAG